MFNEIFEIISCPKCHISFCITKAHDQRLRDSHETAYCPRGHTFYYPGKTQAQKLEEELRSKDKIIDECGKYNADLQHKINSLLSKKRELEKQLESVAKKPLKKPDQPKPKKKLIIHGAVIEPEVVKKIVDEVKLVFSKKDIEEIIKEYTNSKGRKLKPNSLKSYTYSYCKFLVDKGVILETEPGKYQLIQTDGKTKILENKDFINEVCE